MALIYSLCITKYSSLIFLTHPTVLSIETFSSSCFLFVRHCKVLMLWTFWNHLLNLLVEGRFSNPYIRSTWQENLGFGHLVWHRRGNTFTVGRPRGQDSARLKSEPSALYGHNRQQVESSDFCWRWFLFLGDRGEKNSFFI